MHPNLVYVPVSLILFFVLNYVFVYVSVYGCLHVYAGICGGQTRASNFLELDGITGSFELSGCWEPNQGLSLSQISSLASIFDTNASFSFIYLFTWLLSLSGFFFLNCFYLFIFLSEFFLF